MIDLDKITSLDQIIELAKENYGPKPAIISRPRFRKIILTYKDLDDKISHFAAYLSGLNIGYQDKVLLWAPNSPQWVIAFFAILARGAVAVPLNIQSDEDLIKKVSMQTQPKLLVKSKYLFSPPSINHIDLEEITLNKKIKKSARPKIKESDLAEIIYTSGTTGDPKGVMLTHKNILTNVASVVKTIKITEKDRSLSILPLSHMFEQTANLFVPLSSGAQITYPQAISSLAIRKNMIDDQITKLVAVPEFLKVVMDRIEEEAEAQGRGAMLSALVNIASLVPSMKTRKVIFRSVIKKFGGSLDTIVSGGAALDKDIGKKWEALGIYILQGYGTTEASPVITTNTHNDRKIDSVGKPIPQVEVKIAQDSEILVKGPNVTKGYFKNPQKTRESFIDDWYKTGDAGYFDEDGHLHIKGRTKYMIVTQSGQNVFPEDIEFVLNKQPQVKDSTVVGLYQDGKIIIHAVLLGEKIRNPQAIIQNVNERLSSYQQIQDFSVWPFQDFPRTATRKVKKEEVIKFLQKPKEQKRPKKTETADNLAKIIARVTGNPASEIKENQKLVKDLKMDSLERVELVSLIEQELGIALDEAQIGTSTTVKTLKEKIKNRTQKVEKHDFRKWPISPSVIKLRSALNSLILKPAVRFFASPQVMGTDYLKGVDQAIFASNHLSDSDTPIIISALPGRIRQKIAVATASDVLFEDPKVTKFSGIVSLFLNTYPFARHSQGQVKSSLEYTGRLIDRGFSVLIFPEGDIPKTGKMLPFKKGIGLIAQEMGLPIIPIKLEGTNKIIKPGSPYLSVPKRGKTKVKFGKPLHFSQNDSISKVTKKIKQTIKDI